MQIVSNRDTQHEMSNPVSWENKKKYHQLSSAELAKRDVMVNMFYACYFIGVAWYLFLFGAVRKNFGLFFVAYQEHYDTNASVTSLVATMQNIIFSVSCE